MNATSQTIQATKGSLAGSRLVQAYAWLKRNRASSRARRALTEVDARTLRDIGITRRQLAVLTVTDEIR